MAMPAEVRRYLIAAAAFGIPGALAVLFTPEVNYLGTIVALGGVGLLVCSAVLLLAALVAWLSEVLRGRRARGGPDRDR